MCGILGIFEAELTETELRELALKNSKLIRHRGPDWSGVHVYYKANDGDKFDPKITRTAALAHERLAIVNPSSGVQPIFNKDESIVLCVNGEIYNYLDIQEQFPEYEFQSKSDCEVIIPLYEKYGMDLLSHIRGMFTFVIFDKNKRQYFAARDHMGIVPLYIGYRADGGTVLCSELKGLIKCCERFEIFNPGHYYSSISKVQTPWYTPLYYNTSLVPTQQVNYALLRQKFETAVVRRMMSDVPWGVLLSGGLDSSLVASIAARHAKDKVDWPRVHSFCIGLKGSPDLDAAKKVADFLGTSHHSFEFSLREGLDAVSEVIYHIETYDITTIRASVPMFLMARKIKSMGIKMVISGEGADEAFGGYLYFHKAPNKEAFHTETVSKLRNLHYFDCLRANKSMSAFGVEPRVPFLDIDFLDYVMSIDPEQKMCKVRAGDEKRGKIEKFILRKAFDTPENPYLPEELLWRQKEQFSDGVGYSWIDTLRAEAEKEVTDLQWANRKNRYFVNTPSTREGYYYRSIFEKHFPGESARDTVPGGPSIACSTPAAIEWDEEFKRLASQVGGDNSGRAVRGVHAAAYKDVAAAVSGANR